MPKHFKIFLLLIFFIPTIINAQTSQITITEIMYNPDGTDSGREWIEVYNNGTTPIDLSTYKFLENGINHRLSIYNSDDLVLEPDKYAIIADNPEKFLADFSQNGLLIDSAFSLNNTGESISMVDSEDNVIDSVLYTPEWGADGTGNSLQKNGSQWIPAEPTPWQDNKTEADNENSDAEGSDSDSSSDSSTSNSSSDSGSTHSSTTNLSDYKPKVKLKISAGRDRYVAINSPVGFILEHNQDSGSGISTRWSMGDGIERKGEEIEHIYSAPGTYNVVLNAKNGDELATSRSKVFVREPKIDLEFNIWGKTVDIVLKNGDKNEVNLGEFYIKFANKRFKIAKDTIVDPNQTLILRHKITGFSFETDDRKDRVQKVKEDIQKPQISLYFPSGDRLINKELFPNITENLYRVLSQHLDLEQIHKLNLSLEKID